VQKRVIAMAIFVTWQVLVLVTIASAATIEVEIRDAMLIHIFQRGEPFSFDISIFF